MCEDVCRTFQCDIKFFLRNFRQIGKENSSNFSQKYFYVVKDTYSKTLLSVLVFSQPDRLSE